MVQKKIAIPWADKDVWGQVVLSMTRTISALDSELAPVGILSKNIVQLYADIEPLLERVCLSSCSTCSDVCCRRATVWYDMKDLLTIYLTTGAFPEKQIYRRADKSCCKLTASGCRLTRSARPFICTWYICPDQKEVVDTLSDGVAGSALFRVIDELKKARESLEQEYIKVICG